MRRQHRDVEHENHERWIVSYADFITLMFAFFTILFATSEQNVEKVKEFEKSVRINLIKLGAMGDSGEKVNQGVEYNSPIESPLRMFPMGSQETQGVQKKVESFVESKMTPRQIEKAIRDISPDSHGVRLTITADEIFDRGSVQMRSEALPLLDRVAKLIKETNRRVIVEAHSDDVANSKDLYPTAWELASMQATKVLRYFTKVHKVDPSKLAAMSFGDQRPLPPYNRRIELLILTDDMPY